MTDKKERLTTAIRETLANWIDGGGAVDARQINRGEAALGCCDDFASAVYETLGGQRVAYDEMGLFEVGIDGFMMVDDDENYDPGRPLDRALLSKHWPAIQPTQGLDWDDLDRLSEDAGFSVGTHVWLVLDQRHYDAECPEGVDNFFDLPFFQRVIASWKEERENSPAPGC